MGNNQQQKSQQAGQAGQPQSKVTITEAPPTVDITKGDEPLFAQVAQSPTPPPSVIALDLARLSPKELLAMIDKLPPSMLKAARNVIGGGGRSEDERGQATTLPDGRVRVTVTFDSDLGAQLKLWAEAQNEPLAKFIQDAMTSYVQMDWQTVGAGAGA